jgi:uncharacterized protein YkwD
MRVRLVARKGISNQKNTATDAHKWGSNRHMRVLDLVLYSVLGVAVSSQAQSAPPAPPAVEIQPAKAEQLFALNNQSRAQLGLQRLEWDSTLAAAALQHCMRMAAEGPISHRYAGELDLAGRAGEAGAHFSLVEENIAVGSYPATIHQGWLESPGHRSNMLSRDVDHVGIAVVAAQGVILAVADFARSVPVLNPSQVENTIGGLLRSAGIIVRHDTIDARASCVLDRGLPPLTSVDHPQFVMRWQDADLNHLPPDLVERLASRRYRQAGVGSCPARNVEGAFTVYRMAVLLY